MTAINVDMKAVAKMLELDPFFRRSTGCKSPFWMIAFNAAGFGGEFIMPVCREAGLLIELINSPVIRRINWNFHEDSDGGTWVGDSAWQARDEGVMAATGQNFFIEVGRTADHAKRLADVHWSMKSLGALSEDFLRKLLLDIAQKNGDI
jgi:hypothetical protein